MSTDERLKEVTDSTVSLIKTRPSGPIIREKSSTGAPARTYLFTGDRGGPGSPGRGPWVCAPNFGR